MMNVQLSESEFRTINITHSKFNIQPRLAISLSLQAVLLVPLFAQVSRELGPEIPHNSVRSTVENPPGHLESALVSHTSFS
jgi:hypothetical protein